MSLYFFAGEFLCTNIHNYIVGLNVPGVISCSVDPDHYCIIERYLNKTASFSMAEIHGCTGYSS